MGVSMMDRADWVLLSIADAQDDVRPVQLQKALFLLGRNMPDEVSAACAWYDFKPYNYGAYDAEVYQDAEDLATQGLIEIVPAPGHRLRRYRITKAGREKAKQLPVSKRASEYVCNLVAWAQSLTFAELVAKVYEIAPETRKNSIFRG